jgi:hypothetical protein
MKKLLTQIEEILAVNGTHAVLIEIAEAARESLVIGQA